MLLDFVDASQVFFLSSLFFLLLPFYIYSSNFQHKFPLFFVFVFQRSICTLFSRRKKRHTKVKKQLDMSWNLKTQQLHRSAAADVFGRWDKFELLTFYLSLSQLYDAIPAIVCFFLSFSWLARHLQYWRQLEETYFFVATAALLNQSRAARWIYRYLCAFTCIFCLPIRWCTFRLLSNRVFFLARKNKSDANLITSFLKLLQARVNNFLAHIFFH